MDASDVVAAFFAAIDRRDVTAAAALLDEACMGEQVLPGDEAAEPARGRDAVTTRLAGFVERLTGPATGIRVTSVGGIGTGWGWVRAVWTARLRTPEGRTTAFTGHTHFLVEDGAIRRLRSHSRAIAADAVPAEPVPQPRDYPARPVVGVGAVILADGEAQREAGAAAVAPLAVVLVKRRFEPLAGQWSLPGGMLETGETLQAATAREMLEETGLDVEVGAVVEVFDRIMFDSEARVQHHYVLVDYLCAIRSGVLRAGSDVSEVTFADSAHVAEWGVAPKVVDVVRRAVEMRSAAL